MQVNIVMRRVQEDITLRVIRPEDFVSEMESEFVNNSDNPTLDDFYRESDTADKCEYWQTFLCEEPDSECLIFGPDDWQWLKETLLPFGEWDEEKLADVWHDAAMIDDRYSTEF
ncbi:MAG: hypothetical protein HXP18_01715 [Veillonella sp.]|nr:hypothetical protein [Veillonella sp.]